MSKYTLGIVVIAAVTLDVHAADLLNAPDLKTPVEAGLTLALENDLFSLTNKSDRWYTNGLHAAWHFKPGEGPIGSRELERTGRAWFAPPTCAKAYAPGEPGECTVLVTYGFGQNIYTPNVIDSDVFNEQDRPWAGWLYVGAGLSHVKGNRRQTLTYKMGPTGPLALAKPAQTYVHRYLSHSPKPLGWGNQLRPRLGLQLSYLSSHHFNLGETPFGLNYAWGGTLSNLRTMARISAGVTWSLTPEERARAQPGTVDEGEFLFPDFKVNGEPEFTSLRRTVVYANVQAALVPYNAFLQGDTFGGRSQIDVIRQVWTTTIGVTLPLPWGDRRQHKIGLAYKVRSPEFRALGFNEKDSIQRWGVLSWTWVNK